MKLESVATLLEFDPMSQSSTYGHNLGEIVKCADGRWFRFAQCGGTGVSKGKMQVSPAIVADGQNMTVTAASAIGSTEINCTYGTTVLTAGVYDEGYAIVNAGTGLGQVFKIEHSSATTAAGSYALKITLFEPLAVALDTTSKVSVVHNTYSGVREATGSTLRPAGVPLISLTASYFGWLQVRGVAGVLCSSGGATTGYSVVNSASTTAGAIENAGTAGQVVSVGYCLYTGASGEYRPIMLEIN